MSFRQLIDGIFRCFLDLTPGSVLYIDADNDEAALPVPEDYDEVQYHLVADQATGLPAWEEDTGGGSGGDVDPSMISALRAILESKAPILNPNVLGVLRLNGVDITTLMSTGGVDQSQVSALLALVSSKASLFSPNFIGTPKINGTPIPTSGSATDSDQNILATQIFGA